MARKPAKKPSAKKIAELVARVRSNPYSNIYHVAEDVLGGTGFGDEVFDWMREAGWFKCEECNRWKETREEDRSLKDICEGCADEMTTRERGDENEEF